MDALTTTVGDAVRGAIDAAGMTIDGTADESLIPRTTFRRRLADGDFTVNQLMRLALTLNVEPGILLSAIAGVDGSSVSLRPE